MCAAADTMQPGPGHHSWHWCQVTLLYYGNVKWLCEARVWKAGSLYNSQGAIVHIHSRHWWVQQDLLVYNIIMSFNIVMASSDIMVTLWEYGVSDCQCVQCQNGSLKLQFIQLNTYTNSIIFICWVGTVYIEHKAELLQPIKTNMLKIFFRCINDIVIEGPW